MKALDSLENIILIFEGWCGFGSLGNKECLFVI